MYRVAAALLIPLCGIAVGQSSSDATFFAITHVTVIDGTGAEPKLDETVVVARGRIDAVGRSSYVKVPPGAQTVDGTGKFLIPGLWDMHVHTRYEGIDHLRLLLANGITSIRDMGGNWQHLAEMKQWREDIARGRIAGPRIIASGPILDGPGSSWSHSVVVPGPEEGVATVRRLKADGADFVKVYELLSRPTFFAIVAEAKTRGLTFAGHVPKAIRVVEASDAGQVSIEHLEAVLLACSSQEEELRKAPGYPAGDLVKSFSAAKADALFEHLARNKTRVVPTLSLYWTSDGDSRKDSAIVKADRLRYIPGAYLEQWNSRPAGSAQRTSEWLEKCLDLVRRMHAEGVEVLAGTDVVKPFFVPGFSLHDELSLLVKAGFTPMEAIEAATRKPAQFLGIKDLGTIQPGMLADLVLLEGDPVRDIGNTRKIAAVVAAGHLADRGALRTMLSSVEGAAANWKGTPTGR